MAFEKSCLGSYRLKWAVRREANMRFLAQTYRTTTMSVLLAVHNAGRKSLMVQRGQHTPPWRPAAAS